MKLSIIIPAYNVEHYIPHCLESIYGQHVSDNNFEVIVVNDGSTDNTEIIVKEFQKKHNNLTLLTQKNQGASAGRNNGLRHAKGDLIWYVDSDDETTDGSIEKIFFYFHQFPQADFLIFDRIGVDLLHGTEEYWHSYRPNHLTSKTQYLEPLDRVTSNKKLRSAVNWLFVYRRDYLISHDLFFVTGMINEDNEFRMRVFFFAKEVRYIPFAHYKYTLMRPGSVTTVNSGPTMKTVAATIKSLANWDTFEKKYVKSKDDVRFINAFYKKMYERLVTLANTPKESDMYKLYVIHKDSWKKGFKKAYRNSISFKSFSLIDFIRFLVTLYAPKYLKYTKLSTIKSIFKMR